MFCSKCGKQIPDESVFCAYCGANLTGGTTPAQTAELERLYTLARQAQEVDDLKSAAEYYKRILDMVPEDWEAYFYSHLGERTNVTNAEAPSVAIGLGNTLPTAYDFAVASGTPEEIAERLRTISEKAATRLFGIALGGVALLREYEGVGFGAEARVKSDLFNRMKPLATSTIVSADNSIGKLKEKLEALEALHPEIGQIAWIEAKSLLCNVRSSIAQISFSTNMGEWYIINPEYRKKYADEATSLKETLKRLKYDAAVKDSREKDPEELIRLAFAHLDKDEFGEAQARYEALMERLPEERIGYLGNAIATTYINASDSLLPLFELAASKAVDPAYEEATKKLVDYPHGNGGCTVLMELCCALKPKCVSILVDMGADIHKTSATDVTALWFVCYRAIAEKDKENAKKIARLLLEKGAKVDVTSKGGVALFNRNTPVEIGQMIREKHPEQKLGAAASSGGCYVATCVYGSYDCPEVWTLRRYRDDTLGSNPFGRAFIRLYYAVSPTLVKWFGHTAWFKRMWKGKLDRMVSRLQAKGVASSPYLDRDWRK